LAPGGARSKVLPPLWFVGLNEAMAGSVIDALPRTRAELLRFGDRRYSLSLAVADRNATSLYRRLRPVYHDLAVRALAALVIVVLGRLRIDSRHRIRSFGDLRCAIAPACQRAQRLSSRSPYSGGTPREHHLQPCLAGKPDRVHGWREARRVGRTDIADTRRHLH